MGILSKVAKLAYKMTPKRKAALARAVRASARARASKSGVALVRKRVTRKVLLAKVAKASTKKVASRSVKRVTRKVALAKIAKLSTKKAASRSVKRVAKTTVRRTAAVARGRLGAAAVIVGGSAGAAAATQRKASSRSNRSVTVAKINRVSSTIRDAGYGSIKVTGEVVKNTVRVATGSQTVNRSVANVLAAQLKANAVLTRNYAANTANVSRARKNKR